MAEIESSLTGLEVSRVPVLLSSLMIDCDLLMAAASVKRASAQIDVVIHVVGIIYSLPRILEVGEVVEAVSLGAGNSAGEFDLETSARVAEFKFISWQGGSDAVRKKTLFEDFVKLAMYSGAKRRYIYLLDLKVATQFLQGNSSVTRVLDRNARLYRKFLEAYGQEYRTVGQLFRDFQGKIELVDLSQVVPELAILRVDGAISN